MDIRRRRSTRVNLEWAVSLESPAGMVDGKLKNLSLHGMYVSTGCGVPVGASVAVSFRDPGARLPRPVRIGARVVRADENGVGLELGTLDLDSLIMLRSIVGRRVAET